MPVAEGTGLHQQTVCTGNQEPPSLLDPARLASGPEHLGGMRNLKRVVTDRAAVFLDAEEMKAKVRQALIRPTYNVFDSYKKTGIWQRIARSPLFENVTLGVISFNAIWIAVDTDLNNQPLISADPIFQVAESFFCIYFTIELFIRFMAFRRTLDCAKDFWFVFDSLLVAIMLSDTVVLTLVMKFSGSSSNSGLGNASILRLFRLLRLTRMARMLRSWPEIMILIKGMVAAMRSVFFVMILLVMVLYMIGIALVQLSDGFDFHDTYFPTVLEAMLSLLFYTTFYDNMGQMLDDTRVESPICFVLELIYTFLGVAILNMLIGVLCEVVSAVAETEKEEMTVSFVTSKLQQILEKLDENHDEEISKAEFCRIMELPEAVRALQDVGVDPVGVVDFADFIFDEYDDKGHPLPLSFSDFMEVILKLRGGLPATVRDVVDLRKFIYYSLSAMEMRLQNPSIKLDTRPALRSSGKAHLDSLIVQGEGCKSAKASSSREEALNELQAKIAQLEELVELVLREATAIQSQSGNHGAYTSDGRGDHAGHVCSPLNPRPAR